MSDETKTEAQEKADEAQALRDSAAAAQNTVVPEQRPQAFNESPTEASPLTDRIRAEMEEKGMADHIPMPQEAYDAANDEKRKKKTAEQGLPQAVLPASVIRVTDGVNRGRLASVLRIVSYVDDKALLASMSRVPSSLIHEAHPAEIEVAFRGDDRDGEHTVLNLVDKDSPFYAEYQIVPGGYTGRAASVAGAV